jgi:hypothetical protein
MEGILVTGNEVMVGRNGEWHMMGPGVIHQVPACVRRKAKTRNEPRLFHVTVNVGLGPKFIEMELSEGNYAQGCRAPSTIGDKWAWARVAAYVACAYVATGECPNPYATAAGHKCKQCKAPVHNLCSQTYAGTSDLGKDMCPHCRK